MLSRLTIRVMILFENFWITQFTFNHRCPNIYEVDFLRKNENWMEYGRLRGWAVLVLAALDPSTASTRTAQPLDLPFLVEFSVFLQKCTPYMLGHLWLNVNWKIQISKITIISSITKIRNQIQFYFYWKKISNNSSLQNIPR